MDSLNLIPKEVVDLNSVITTAELSQRPSRPPDYAAENRALVGLTQALAHSPNGVLQKLAETALTLCRAHSAGVSLLEPEGKNFYWPAVAGQWACYVGGRTPRDYGPCGAALDRDEPQLMSHPERHFTPFASVTPSIEEALLIPFRVDGKAVGTIWVIVHDQSRQFDAEDLRVMTDLGQFAAAAYQVFRDQQNAIERLRQTIDELTREAEIRRRAETGLRESERRMQEHATELADLHRRKDEFLAMLSHELRNPLSPILNAAHILRLQKEENPLQQQARAVIERQVNQLSRLVNELLEVSRVITGRIRLRQERLDIRGIVEQAVESTRPLIDQRRHRIFISLPAEPVWLEGDAARLEQIVINLLDNAAKYTPEGGKIWVNLQPESNEVRLRVRDTGIGIAPELLPRIFDLFTQADRTPDRSQGGLGIGLSLTQRLVELHGGKIEAHSAGLGQSSEFIVRLPVLLPSERGADMTSTGTSKQAAQGWRMLVVDDNVDAANMIAMVLQHYGHQTETVYSAHGALEKAVEYRPDFVLLDIGLPGMDGYEVARRLRQIPELKGTRLIAATGYGQDADRQRSEEAGFDYHLVKPIDPEKLQEVLELLGRQPRSSK